MFAFLYNLLDQNILIYLSIHFILLIIFVFMNRRTILKHFLRVKRETWILLFLIFLFGFFLRNAEYWYGLNLDDYVPLETAKYLLLEGKHVKACSGGMLGECYAYHQVLQPPGFPYLITLIYIVFGINSMPVLAFSGILSSITIIIIFLLCYLMFRNEKIGLYSSLVFAIIPIDIFFSGTGNVRVISVFFTALTILFFLIALKKNDMKTWILFALAFSFSTYIRQENYVMFIPFIAGMIITRYDIIENINKLIVAQIVFSAFQIHNLYWIFRVAPGLFVHPMGLPLTSHACMIRAAPHIAWFLSGLVHDMILMPYNCLATILFVAGMALSFFYLLARKRSGYWLFFVSLLFITFFLTYSSYCLNFMDGLSAGPDSDYMRYTMQLHVPYSILAGYALYVLHKRLRKEAVMILVGLLIAVSLVYALPAGIFMDSRTTHEPDSDYFDAIKKIPPNSTIITMKYMLVASDVVGEERRVISMDTMALNESVEHAIRLIHESRAVYYLEEEYCEYSADYGCRFISDNLNLVYSFSEGDAVVYRVLVDPDKDYTIVWDDLVYDVRVRSNKIMSTDKHPNRE
jgi:4-amino-4-deoxy-L-arabinose transferase-like glycosyltransferase